MLERGKIFTKLETYQQLKLDTESQKYLVIRSFPLYSHALWHLFSPGNLPKSHEDSPAGHVDIFITGEMEVTPHAPTDLGGAWGDSYRPWRKYWRLERLAKAGLHGLKQKTSS